MEPRTMPSARLGCTMAAAPDCGSVSRRTRQNAVPEMTWPQRRGTETVRPVSHAGLDPTSGVTVWFTRRWSADDALPTPVIS